MVRWWGTIYIILRDWELKYDLKNKDNVLTNDSCTSSEYHRADLCSLAYWRSWGLRDGVVLAFDAISFFRVANCVWSFARWTSITIRFGWSTFSSRVHSSWTLAALVLCFQTFDDAILACLTSFTRWLWWLFIVRSKIAVRYQEQKLKGCTCKSKRIIMR